MALSDVYSRMTTHDHTVSRRDFMSGVAAVWLTAAIACSKESARDEVKSAANPLGTMTDTPAPAQTLTHFSVAQGADIDAIASRIIPTDDAPGAKEAGVVYFIDRMLGAAAKEQVPLFDGGLVALSKYVTNTFPGKTTFAALTAEQQDLTLRSMEKTPFFGAMRFATIAGFLSLPKYGGNRDFVGWKFIGQEHTMEQKPPFGWYDRPENQMTLLGRVL